MRFAVIGAGAIGGYYGGLLSEVADVTFIARGETLEALRNAGLQLIEGHARRTIAVKATDRSTDVGPVDVVIVTTKTRDLRDALAAVAPLIDPRTVVMPVQNGVEAPYVAAEYVPRSAVVPCIVRGFIVHEGPGAVAYHGGPRSFTFNSWDNDRGPVIDRIAEAIRSAGFDAVVPDDVWVDLWEKAAFAVPFGALGALTHQPLHVLRGPLREQLERTIVEICNVATARGVALPSDVVARILAFADAMPAEATSSMQRDLMAGRPSELDGQVGGIIRLAREVGVATPQLDLMHAVLEYR